MIIHKDFFTGSEDDLVKLFIKLNPKIRLISTQKPQYYQEVTIKQIRRRSDLIIKIPKRVVNIEFKLHDVDTVIRQAKDHCKWADYSYICMPISSILHRRDLFTRLIKTNIGLIVGSNTGFYELIGARYNSFKKGKDRSIRDSVLKKLK